MRQGGGRVRSSVDLPPGVTAAEADGQYPRALMSLLAESGLRTSHAAAAAADLPLTSTATANTVGPARPAHLSSGLLKMTDFS
jgi:hypothetical protein